LVQRNGFVCHDREAATLSVDGREVSSVADVEYLMQRGLMRHEDLGTKIVPTDRGREFLATITGWPRPMRRFGRSTMPSRDEIKEVIQDAIWPPPDYEPAFWGVELDRATDAVLALFTASRRPVMRSSMERET